MRLCFPSLIVVHVPTRDLLQWLCFMVGKFEITLAITKKYDQQFILNDRDFRDALTEHQQCGLGLLKDINKKD